MPSLEGPLSTDIERQARPPSIYGATLIFGIANEKKIAGYLPELSQQIDSRIKPPYNWFNLGLELDEEPIGAARLDVLITGSRDLSRLLVANLFAKSIAETKIPKDQIRLRAARLALSDQCYINLRAFGQPESQDLSDEITVLLPEAANDFEVRRNHTSIATKLRHSVWSLIEDMPASTG